MTTQTQKPQLHLTRPRDRSWQAYRDWLVGFAARINPNSRDDRTDAQWQKAAADFWAKVDAENKRPS